MNLRSYEIWLGWYHLGQGYSEPSKPELVAVIRATSFKIACVIYEHRLAIDTLNQRMGRKDTYIEDIHFGKWYYDPLTNSNSWTGKYYESKEEAQKSFRQ
jgi:hypothetical protein